VNGTQSLFSLTGKTAFISGASGGIGLHIARVLAQAGAAVVLAARRVDKVQAEVANLRADGYRTCGVALDVTSLQSITEAWESAQEEIGAPIDILINNAGILYAERFLSQRLEDIERIFDTNLKGAFLLSMAKGGSGSIINIASTSGLRAAGHLSSYGASKAALLQLTQTMALELARKGVRVNALCPGNFRTEMHLSFQENGLEENILQRIPMRKIGEVGQLDGAVLLLASDAGSYMTGSVVVVDGGQTLSWM
jgi:NAD(P)-dependent dehydrogenase (short-subunit alcohol dehydrogenase family)